MSSSSDSYDKSSDGQEAGEEESVDPSLELFGHFAKDPLRCPSTKYLERLDEKFAKFCTEEAGSQGPAVLSIFRSRIQEITRLRELALTWSKPDSLSYHFEGTEFFDGFIEKRSVDNRDSPPFRPWEKRTRKEIEEWMSRQQQVTYTPKHWGIFSQSVNKFVQKMVYFSQTSRVIHLPSATKEKPLLARVVDPGNDQLSGHGRWPFSALVLVGHDTVVGPKKDAPIFLPSPRVGCRQLICCDITFMGLVFPPSILEENVWMKEDESRNLIYPRFYGCTFTDTLILIHEALLIDCRGAKVLIAPGKNARLLNCKFAAEMAFTNCTPLVV